MKRSRSLSINSLDFDNESNNHNDNFSISSLQINNSEKLPSLCKSNSLINSFDAREEGFCESFGCDTKDAKDKNEEAKRNKKLKLNNALIMLKSTDRKHLISSFSQAIYTLTQDPDDEDNIFNLRNLYLRWIQMGLQKQDFIIIAEEVCKKLDEPTSKEQKQKMKVSMYKDEYIISKIFESSYITVGRLKLNDFVSPEDAMSISRIHIICIQTKDKVFIVDIGSLLGIRTVRRSSGKPFVHSIERARRTLVFDKHETFVLKAGNIDFEFTPF